MPNTLSSLVKVLTVALMGQPSPLYFDIKNPAPDEVQTGSQGAIVISSQNSIIDRLPEEIIIEILKFLPQSALYETSSVNRKFNRLSVPFLYESFDQHGNSPRSLFQFLKAIKKVPQFLDFTRRIDIYGSPRISRLQVERRIANNPGAKWARHIYTHHQYYGYMHVEHGPDVAVLMLLSSNPNIRSVTVHQLSNTAGRHPNPPLPIYLAPLQNSFRLKYPLPLCFKQLSSLEFRMSTITWRTIVPLFRLPSLKRLEIGGATEDDEFVPPKNMKIFRSSSIKNLAFRCTMSVQTAMAAVSTCRALQTFEHFWKESDDLDSYKDLHARLYEHRSTLTNLSLYGLKKPDCKSNVEISFVDFPALKTIALDHWNITPKTLPSSLERLLITAVRDDSQIFNSLCRLVISPTEAKIRTGTRVLLHYLCRGDSGRHVNFQKVNDLFKSRGFHFELFAAPIYGHLWTYAAIVNESEARMHSLREQNAPSLELLHNAHALAEWRSRLAHEYYTARTQDIKVVQDLTKGCYNYWNPEEDDESGQLLPFITGD